jgi:hypothetical protein
MACLKILSKNLFWGAKENNIKSVSIVSPLIEINTMDEVEVLTVIPLLSTE